MNDERPRRYRATPSSLSRAAQIADALKLPFNADLTEAHANELLRLYFDDIRTVLPNQTKRMEFTHLALPEFQAYADIKSEARPHVFVDQRLSMWLYDLNFVMATLTYAPLISDDEQRLAVAFGDLMAVPLDPICIETVREDIWPIMRNQTTAIPLAHALTIAMIVMVMCHEIAHHELGHLSRISRHQDELDADRWATQYFQEVRAASNRLEHAGIATQAASAPILLMRFLELFQCVNKDRLGNVSPPASERRYYLERIGTANWSKVSLITHRDCSDMLDQLSAWLRSS